MSRNARLAAALLVLPLVAGVAACSSSASADGAASATCPNGKIRFGVEPYEDPAKLLPAYQTLAKALGDKLDCPVEVQVVDDYSAEVLAMQNGELELGEFGPLGFVFATDRAKAEALASFATADGKLSTYTAGIWVPKDSPIQKVADLKGKGLALGSTGSTSGDAMPRKALADAGIAEKDVHITYAGGHPEAMLALVNGQVDAAEINSQTQASATAEGKFDASKYREIWVSGDLPNDPITVAGSASPEFKKAVKDALLSLDASTVKQIGEFLDVDPAGPLVAVDKSTYQELFDLAASLHLTEKDV